VNFGDIVFVDFGTPIGSEAGFVRPAIILTADAFLQYRPSTVFAVPLTTTRRTFPSHVQVEPDQANCLRENSWALVEQLRAVAVERCSPTTGNIGPSYSYQVLEVLAVITGMPPI
jgi:mRNA interferase MazF